MKQKFFAIGAIAVIAIVGVFVFEHATSAQRPDRTQTCLLYTSPSPRDRTRSRMPSSA